MRGIAVIRSGAAYAALALSLVSAAHAQSQVNGSSPSRPGDTQAQPDPSSPLSTVADTPAKPGSDAAAEIVVSGIRASQRQSIDIKRNAINSVDAIASEDLGKMPDQNVAESLQRVPGITIDRDRGVGNGVTVRGLGPEFNTVTVNGRVIATDSAGREFNFDLLPSELIAGASVYKSPQANLNGASIGATVDVKTLRPLEQRTGLRGGGSLRLNYDQLGDKKTPSGAAYLTWKSNSGKVGASLVGSYDDKYERTDNFAVGASSYPRSFDDGYYGNYGTAPGGTPYCADSQGNASGAPRIGSGVKLFCGVDMYHNLTNNVEFSHRRRLGIDGTFQYKPTDNLVLRFDGLYSRDNEHYHGSGIAPDFTGGTLVNQVVSGGTDSTQVINGVSQTVHTGGTAVAETFHDGTVDMIVEDRPAVSTTKLFGFNAKWDKGPFTVALDIDSSNARYDDSGGLFTTSRLKHVDYTYDRRTGSPIAQFTMSTPTNPTDAATDTTHRLAHYLASEGQIFNDLIHEGRLDAGWDDGGAISAFGGLGYSERTKTTIGFVEPNSCAYCGSDVVLPSSLFTPTNYNFFGNRVGGNTNNWVDYNAQALFNAMVAANTSSDPALHTGNLLPIQRDPAGSSSVREKVALGYLMFQYKGDLAGMPLAINTGVRIEDTSFSSKGSGQTVLSAKNNGTGQNNIVLSGLTPLSFHGHYTDVLPSINARLNLSDTLILRAAASRVISRPTLTDLSPAQSITSNPGNERITRGNPNLRPFRASQAEAGLEWYYNPHESPHSDDPKSAFEQLMVTNEFFEL